MLKTGIKNLFSLVSGMSLLWFSLFFEYKPFRETMYLMISPVNALYFMASVAR